MCVIGLGTVGAASKDQCERKNVMCHPSSSLSENLVTVATLMGHSRLDTTAIYTQPSRRDLEEAVEKLADPG